MIKAIAGGGGRGMRIVEDASKLEEAYARCQSEAKAAFGSDSVYVERLIRKARHIEVQIIGDRFGAISHLWERECTIQRRNQKLIEIAPSPSLDDGLRSRIIDAARQLAAAARYDNLGTFEFLVDDGSTGSDRAFAFIEANPRLQVEHTVTEEVLGIDLVKSQLAVAAGATLASLGLAQAAIPAPRGYAMQLRINMEVMDETGRPGRPAERSRCSIRRPARACGSIRLVIAGTGPVPPSTRCSPRSSFIRPRQAGPMSCRRPRARCANFGSGVSQPTYPSSRPCWRIPISSPTASLPVSSIAMLPRWSAPPRKSPGRCSSQPGRLPARRHLPKPANP